MTELLSSYLPQDRLAALASGQDLPDRAHGAALLADISGFTPLTEQLTQQLGPRRGVEELARRINAVYDALIGEIERYGGSVVGFAGDAMTCWFDDLSPQPLSRLGKEEQGARSSDRAVAAALALQAAMCAFPELGIKVAVASGPVRRFVVGDPAIQQLDTLAGATLSRLANTEHLARRGEVVVDAATLSALGDTVQSSELHTEGDQHFAVVHTLSPPIAPALLPPPVRVLAAEELRLWVLTAVFAREQSGLGAFLTELRPAIPLFMSFGGLDYDGEEAAGDKLDAVIRRAQDIVHRYEGALLQLTIGDKGSYLYANFGAIAAHEDDARRAVQAALELQALPQEFDFLQDVKIGVTSGTLRAGAYGGATRRTYGALGDDVNLAARLMQAAAADEILVSQRVQTATAGQFGFTPQPPLAVKGKTGLLTVFTVTGAPRGGATRLREPVYRLPMIGRQDELTLIAGKLALARQGRGQVIGITAEAGMGKSRLVAEVIRLAQGYGFTGYGSACESSGANTSYLVWRAIWQAFFDLDPTTPVQQQLRHLAGEIEHRAPDRLSAMPLLAPLVDLSIDDNEFTRALQPKDRRNALEALLVDCLKSAVKAEPILFVLEDMHWIDPLSHDLLETLARASMSLPACFVLVYRPPEIARLQAPRAEALSYFTKISLNQLTPPEAEQLIRAKLAQLFPEGDGRLAQGLITQLTTKAQGNPFCIEELLNYLRDRGISPDDEQALKSLELPSSLHTLVLSRIDQLTEAQKVTLKVASIIGRLFRFAWLLGYHPTLGAPDVVKTDLGELARLDLTPLDTPEPDLTYLFQHIVTQEVAYESLTYAMRAQLHEQLAQFLEAQDAGKYLDLLAFHYGRSENVAKQREYLRKAGEAAQAAYANPAALDYYDRLLPLVAERSEQIELNQRRGAVLAFLGDLNAAEAAYRCALSLADGAADAYASARCQRGLGGLCCDRGDYAAALMWLERARDGWRALNEQPELARTLIEMGQALYCTGECSAARQTVVDGLAAARATQDRAVSAHGLSNLGAIELLQGNFAAAQALLAESLTLHRETGDRWGAESVLNNMALAALYQGDDVAARAWFEESLALAREMGNKQDTALALMNLGHVACAQGEHAAAQPLYAESLALFHEIGDRYNTACSLIGMARVAAGMGGDMSRAAHLAGAAAAVNTSIGATVEPFEHDLYERAVDAARSALGEEAFDAAFAAGQQMTLAEAVQYALAHDGAVSYAAGDARAHENQAEHPSTAGRAPMRPSAQDARGTILRVDAHE